MTKQLIEFIEPPGTSYAKLCIMHYELCIKRSPLTLKNIIAFMTCLTAGRESDFFYKVARSQGRKDAKTNSATL